MAAKIKLIKSLVLDFQRMHQDVYDLFPTDLKTLDCEFSDHVPTSHLSDEFVKMVALCHGVNPSEFNHIQSIF